MTEEIVELAMKLGSLDEGDRERAAVLCRTAEEELRRGLKEGVAPENCGEAFSVAAAWLALADMEPEDGVEQFSAGDLSVRRTGHGERSKRLREQAWRLMAPYEEDGGFRFQGVPG